MPSLHNSLQPIMNLQTNILSYICLLASSRVDDWYYPATLREISPEEDRSLHDILPSRSFASFNLLCKRAREIALASPRCWEDVLVVIQDNHVINGPSLLEQRLARSKSSPLNLFLCIKYPKNNSASHQRSAKTTVDQPNRKTAFELLTPHVRRFQHITIYNPGNYRRYHPVDTGEFLDLLSCSYPSLNQLTIIDHTSSTRRSSRQFDWYHFWAIGYKPNLACVELAFSAHSGVFTTPRSLIAPPGVRRLRLQWGYSYCDVIAFLRQSPQLEHFDWDSFVPEEHFQMERSMMDRSKSTVLPSLLSLRLRRSAPHPGAFMLVAPKCEELYLHEVKDLWDEGPISSRWNRLTLPQLKRFSVSRPTSDGSVGDDLLWDGMGGFLNRHQNLEDFICYAPPENPFDDNHWRWPMAHVAYSLGPERQAPLLPDLNGTIAGPLPKLRTIWFEVDSNNWSSDLWPCLKDFIRAMLLSRPRLIVNLRAWPITGYKEAGYYAGNGRWIFYPSYIEALANEINQPREKREGMGADSSGRLNLLSADQAMTWPEAWGCIIPHTASHIS
ncbi:hypothetical protein DL93DRAFT_2080396 [Clavulina sp. PMI_390]|nr:hypothetical protein DL93DRAFT_2080396 [Clavulina sp. PMI_390]